MKVIVIGGGAAGMLSAITVAKQGKQVIILEKMNSLGRKLLITGKGRCNITSSLPIEEFIKNIPGNGKFLYSAFQNFNNIDIIQLLKEQGVEVKEERGNRIFPVSDKSMDVLMALQRELKKYKVKVECNKKVEEILVENNQVTGVRCNNQEIIQADKIILATGGMSYPATGSTGDGYTLAKELGHTIQKIKPSLVPLIAEKDSLNICKQLQGLSLKNVQIKIIDSSSKKEIYQDFGEMLFTHFGVSGPIILSSSAHLLRYKNVDKLMESHKIKLRIDLKPALSKEKLDARILRDFEKYKNKEIKNALVDLLPQKLIPVMIQVSHIEETKKVNILTKKERETLIENIKEFSIGIQGFRGIEEAIITAGGISTKEINPKTMQSKLIHGLYFAGEIIDVDAYTGGFNLQIAFSTGVTAGMLLE